MAMPLTYQQEFYLRTLGATDDAFRVDAFSFCLIGKPNLAVIRQSFDSLTSRHASLRTRIVVSNDCRVQEFPESCEWPLQMAHLPEVSTDETATSLPIREFLRTFTEQKIDLSADGLLKVAVVNLRDDAHVLVIGMHHLIFDGWALDILFQEFWFLYNAFLHGQVIEAQVRAAQYPDYVLWQERVHRAWTKTHKPYWIRRLAGSAGIRWPVDNSGHRDMGVLHTHRPLSAALSAGLHDAARRVRKHPPMLLLAAYVSVIRFWCNQNDFVVTTVLNDRDRAEHRTLIGFLAHPVFLRVQLSGDESFIALMDLLSREYLSTILHRDFGETVLERFDLCAGTIFQWLPPRKELTNLSEKYGFQPESLPPAENAIFPRTMNIMFYLFEVDDCLTIWMRYRPEFISTCSVERFLQMFESTLDRLVQNPNAKMADMR